MNFLIITLRFSSVLLLIIKTVVVLLLCRSCPNEREAYEILLTVSKFSANDIISFKFIWERMKSICFMLILIYDFKTSIYRFGPQKEKLTFECFHKLKWTWHWSHWCRYIRRIAVIVERIQEHAHVSWNRFNVWKRLL